MHINANLEPAYLAPSSAHRLSARRHMSLYTGALDHELPPPPPPDVELQSISWGNKKWRYHTDSTNLTASLCDGVFPQNLRKSRHHSTTARRSVKMADGFRRMVSTFTAAWHLLPLQQGNIVNCRCQRGRTTSDARRGLLDDDNLSRP